jgi:hypothetical protein
VICLVVDQEVWCPRRSRTCGSMLLQDNSALAICMGRYSNLFRLVIHLSGV